MFVDRVHFVLIADLRICVLNSLKNILGITVIEWVFQI